MYCINNCIHYIPQRKDIWLSLCLLQENTICYFSTYSNSHQSRFEKLTWISRSTQYKLGSKDGGCNMSASPTKWWLTYKNMKLAQKGVAQRHDPILGSALYQNGIEKSWPRLSGRPSLNWVPGTNYLGNWRRSVGYWPHNEPCDTWSIKYGCWHQKRFKPKACNGFFPERSAWGSFTWCFSSDVADASNGVYKSYTQNKMSSSSYCSYLLLERFHANAENFLHYKDWYRWRNVDTSV